MTENMKLAIEAINKWFYFSMNYETVLHNWKDVRGEPRSENIPGFLAEAKWTCNLDHMLSKWKAATKSRNPSAYLTDFYGELDIPNRIALIEWLMTNYNGEKKIF